MRALTHTFAAAFLGMMFLGISSGVCASDDDTDKDGLTEAEEMLLGTDPHDRDSDDDHYPDGFEHLKGSSPTDGLNIPNILTISLRDSGDKSELVLAVETFIGKHFQIEHCPIAQDWQPFGPTVLGDGGHWETRISTDQLDDCGFFRVRFFDTVTAEILGGHSLGIAKNGQVNQESETAPVGGQNGNNGGGDGEEGDICNVPDTIEDITVELDDDGEKRLFYFDTNGTGHMMEQDGTSYEFTPFTFTSRKIGKCRMEIVITYPTDEGDSEVEVIKLNYKAEAEGDFTDNFYENGDLEESSQGNFRIIDPEDLPFEAWPAFLEAS